MKTSKKRGFTIVELVIVIAVIAILAGVLIPAFASIVKKANESADVQAVSAMNKYLAISEVTEVKSINQVYEALKEGGMTAKDYRPLYTGRYFFWDKASNRIVYTDENYKVLYPENTTVDMANLLSLSGEIREEVVGVPANGEVTLDASKAAEQLYYLSHHTAGVTKITLPSQVNLMGANLGFNIKSGSLSIVGDATNGTTISGMVQNSNAFVGSTDNVQGVEENVGKEYGAGFIANIQGDSTVTIENINIVGSEIGDLEIGQVGAIVGRIAIITDQPSNVAHVPTVTIKNCNVTNCVVNGKNKVGALVGGVSGNLSVKNCKIDGVTVNCSEGESGKAIGNTYGNGSVTIDAELSSWVTNTALNLVQDSAHNREVKTGTITIDSTVCTDYSCIVRKLDADFTPASSYRFFASDAIMTITTYNAPTVTINGTTKTKATGAAPAVKIDGTAISVGILDICK